ncbi:hypothetical protein B0J18DRAFT_455545 [Chaetomium sp. MPI-SDFR-AT-0129]|nr:hypothetical protein B0J18DRAFT_455545 [Chaetomium sp. MPI-SDFR-AT-0129]
MPYLRGIEVSLSTKPKNEPIPEYPHPEGVSAQLLEASAKQCNGGGLKLRAGPTVSVYIPSVPETQFALNYNINSTPPEPCKYIFFRLYVNARPIASWGIDPGVQTHGKVVRSFWAPSARCSSWYSDQGADSDKIECRTFVFLPGLERRSVAEDGGVIEVQVFRAKNRIVRTPKLEEYRHRENYGIAEPSVGLLPRPQEAHFYDWVLVDPKDAPFVTFRFHYRSLKNLQDLNLIPTKELELLCTASPKAVRAFAAKHTPGLVRKELVDTKESGGQSSGSDNTSSDGAVFHDCKEKPDENENREDEDTNNYSLKSPPELFTATLPNVAIPQPSKAARDGQMEPYSRRPLPELPGDDPIQLSRRSSASSVRSRAVSIAASLREWVEGESFNPEETELGVAQIVQIPRTSPVIARVHGNDKPEAVESSESDYETSPIGSPDDTLRVRRISPRRYLPMTGSGLERGMALLASPKQAASLDKGEEGKALHPGACGSDPTLVGSSGLTSAAPTLVEAEEHSSFTPERSSGMRARDGESHDENSCPEGNTATAEAGNRSHQLLDRKRAGYNGVRG